MRAGASKIVVVGLLFLMTLLSGLLLSRGLRQSDPRLSGQPFAGAAFTVHKFVALATAILLGVTIRNLHKGVQFGGIEWMAVILGGLFFLLMFLSGGLQSVAKTANGSLRLVHEVAALFTVVPTLGAVWLLIRSRR